VEERGIPESDDLEGARHTLKTGYGQSKWVSEKLLFEAGRRGLRGYILRPGYIVGESTSAGELYSSHSSGMVIYSG
jgi:L-aminoadipate-semialdehyde dehydrogenase